MGLVCTFVWSSHLNNSLMQSNEVQAFKNKVAFYIFFLGAVGSH